MNNWLWYDHTLLTYIVRSSEFTPPQRWITIHVCRQGIIACNNNNMRNPTFHFVICWKPFSVCACAFHVSWNGGTQAHVRRSRRVWGSCKHKQVYRNGRALYKEAEMDTARKMNALKCRTLSATLARILHTLLKRTLMTCNGKYTEYFS